MNIGNKTKIAYIYSGSGNMGDWIKKLSMVQKLTVITAATVIALGTIFGGFGTARCKAQEVVCAAVHQQAIKIADSIVTIRIVPIEAKLDTLIKSKKEKDSVAVDMWYLMREMAKPDQIVAAKNRQNEVEHYPKK